MTQPVWRSLGNEARRWLNQLQWIARRLIRVPFRGFRVARAAPVAIRREIWERFLTRRPRLITTNTGNGRLTYSTRDLVIGHHLFVYGNYEADLIARAIRIMDRAGTGERSVLVDVGANIGMSCIAFLRMGAAASAIAIEPDPFNFELLERNVRQNGLGARVRCIQSAAGAMAGFVTLERSSTNLGAHFVKPPNESIGEQRTSIDTVDALVRSAGVEFHRIRLLWMDVEGYEGYVLSGAPNVLASSPFVAAEVWPVGIERSGFGRDRFLGLTRERFSAFFDLADPESLGDVEFLPDVYDRMKATNRFSQFLFVSRQPLAAAESIVRGPSLS